MALRTLLRCSRAILIALWLAHQARSHPMQYWAAGEPLRPSRHEAVEDWEMKLQNVRLSEIKRSRRTELDEDDPSGALLEYIQSILDLQESNVNIYKNANYNLHRRLESLIRDIANLVRSSTRRYKQRQEKDKIPSRRDVDFWSGDERPGEEDPYQSELPNFGLDEWGISSRQFPSPNVRSLYPESSLSLSRKLPYLPDSPTLRQRETQILPLQSPIGGWSHADTRDAIRERPLISRPMNEGLLLPPTWLGMDAPPLPPSMTVNVTDSNFGEIYISPSPNYDIMDLLGELISSPTRSLTIGLQANERGDCVYIEDINGERVDSNFEWRIIITNRERKEIWNSQCLPPESLKLRFGFHVTFTYGLRYGLVEGESSQISSSSDRPVGIRREDLL